MPTAPQSLTRFPGKGRGKTDGARQTGRSVSLMLSTSRAFLSDSRNYSLACMVFKRSGPPPPTPYPKPTFPPPSPPLLPPLPHPPQRSYPPTRPRGPEVNNVRILITHTHTHTHSGEEDRKREGEGQRGNREREVYTYVYNYMLSGKCVSKCYQKS